MDLNLGKKGKKEREKKETLKIIDCEIVRVVNNDYGVYFDMKLNGIKINGCSLQQTKDEGKVFIGFPSKQGKDKKYYPVVSAYISDDDTQKIIEMIDAKLNG
jgi:hypothetical protein